MIGSMSVSGGPDWLADLVDVAQATIELNVVAGRSAAEPARYLRAGAGYPDPWTRDAAINAWQAASWLVPGVAGATLEMVCERAADQELVSWDDQWWDQVIWIVGAWHHAAITGDPAWADRAWRVGAATIAKLEERLLDPQLGLFTGPAVMADGITGYPAALHDPARTTDSFVLDHAAARDVFALSTNALYTWCYSLMADLALITGHDPQRWLRARGAHAGRVRAMFARPDGGWAYLLAEGNVEDPVARPVSIDGRALTGFDHQESLGLAMLVHAGVIEAAEGAATLAAAWRAPSGVVAVSPHTDGYDDSRFGRHGVACWPMITGVWCEAVASTGDAATFGADLDAFAALVRGSGNRFFEVYHPVTGQPDGGWQAGRSWRSEPDQTWSATAFLGGILYGLLGLRPTWSGLRMSPCVPDRYSGTRVDGLRWRSAVVDVAVHGSGRLLEARLDGAPLPDATIPADLEGRHTLDLYCRS